MSRPAPLLTESTVSKTLLILGANVLQSLKGSVNSIWVGRVLGSVVLTATSNANTVMFFLISMVFGVGTAGSILVGQAMGAGDLDRAKRVVGAAKSWLPPGVERAKPATATIFAAHFTEASFVSVYDEAGIFFHVRRRLLDAAFCPWMVVTDDVALIVVRELLGYPKKLARVTFDVGDGGEGSVVRAEVE